MRRFLIGAGAVALLLYGSTHLTQDRAHRPWSTASSAQVPAGGVPVAETAALEPRPTTAPAREAALLAPAPEERSVSDAASEETGAEAPALRGKAPRHRVARSARTAHTAPAHARAANRQAPAVVATRQPIQFQLADRSNAL